MPWFPSMDEDEIDRDDLIIDPIVVEDATTPVDEILRPAFDAIWNACGHDECKDYDESGRWRERRGG